MNVESALAFVEALIFNYTQKQMTDLQRAVFRGAWQGKSFQEIHKTDCAYVGLDYLMKHVGSKLWHLLSEVLGEEVTKSKLRGPVERVWLRQSYESRQLAALTEPKFIEGQVPLTSSLYIERPPTEAQCYQELMQPGALLRITSPKQMGKTSLLAGLLYRLREKKYRTVTLSFHLADAAVFSRLDKLLKWFCFCIGQSLELPNQLADYWANICSSNYNSTTYFEKYLLAETDSPLVIGLDDVERIFSYPEVANDFFNLLHVWHDKARSSDQGSKMWEKLRLIVVYSTEAYALMNINQLPLNEGLSIHLPEFKLEQVKDLAQRYGLDWSDTQAAQLQSLVSGHPYLVQVALHHVAHSPITLNQFLQIATTEAGPYSDHLQRYLWNLEQHLQLATALYEVVAANRAVELKPTLAFKLQSMGLVKMEGNSVKPSCDLYRQYFCERLRGIVEEKQKVTM